MADQTEDRIVSLFPATAGDVAPPREVYERLELVARMLRGAPAPASSHFGLWWLDSDGKVAAVPAGVKPMVIGRDASCDLILESPRLSRRHCAIRRFNGGLAALEIEDLGSSNGTWVNGVRLPIQGRRILFDGDVVEIGGVALVVAVPGPAGGPSR